MPNTKNLESVKKIKERLNASKNILIVNPQGLNVNDQTELRRQLKDAGGEFTVHKNTLIRVALESDSSKVPESVYDHLNGPTAVVYGYEDAVSATKVAVKFASEHSEMFKIKFGLLIGDGEASHTALSEAAIENLAKLPSKDQLRANLVGQLQAPLQGFANVLSGNLRGLVQVLNAHRQNLSQ